MLKTKRRRHQTQTREDKGFGGGNNVQREAFAGTSEALNALQVKFDCGEGNDGG